MHQFNAAPAKQGSIFAGAAVQPSVYLVRLQHHRHPGVDILHPAVRLGGHDGKVSLLINAGHHHDGAIGEMEVVLILDGLARFGAGVGVFLVRLIEAIGWNHAAAVFQRSRPHIRLAAHGIHLP